MVRTRTPGNAYNCHGTRMRLAGNRRFVLLCDQGFPELVKPLDDSSTQVSDTFAWDYHVWKVLDAPGVLQRLLELLQNLARPVGRLAVCVLCILQLGRVYAVIPAHMIARHWSSEASAAESVNGEKEEGAARTGAQARGGEITERERESQTCQCVLLCASIKTDAPPSRNSVTRYEHGRVRPRTSRLGAGREVVIASIPQPATVASFLNPSSCTRAAFASTGADKAKLHRSRASWNENRKIGEEERKSRALLRSSTSTRAASISPRLPPHPGCAACTPHLIRASRFDRQRQVARPPLSRSLLGEPGCRKEPIATGLSLAAAGSAATSAHVRDRGIRLKGSMSTYLAQAGCGNQVLLALRVDTPAVLPDQFAYGVLPVMLKRRVEWSSQ